MLQPAQIAISDRYSAIVEQSPTAIGVARDSLIVAKPKKLNPNRAKLRKKFIDVHDAGGGCCPTTATTSLHSTWVKRKAIQNYENFMNSEYDANLNWATSIDTVAATSLGIEGWALFDVGTSEEAWTSSGTTSTTVREGRGAAPLSMCLIGSCTNMFKWYPLACADPPRPQASGAITCRYRRRATTSRYPPCHAQGRSPRRFTGREFGRQDHFLQARRR